MKRKARRENTSVTKLSHERRVHSERVDGHGTLHVLPPVCIAGGMLYFFCITMHGEEHGPVANASEVDKKAINGSGEHEVRSRLYDVIDRRENLSYSEFMVEYASKQRPVVITDYGVSRLFPNISGSTDTWKFLQRYCGSMPVQIGHRSSSKSATSTGMLFDTHVLKLSRFVREIDSPSWQGAYVFDRSLNDVGDMEGCRALLEQFVVPRYFTGDLVKQMKLTDPVNEDPFIAHPSLFIGTANSSCGLHVDAFESNFWQAVLAGRKTWHVFAIPAARQKKLLDQYGASADFSRYMVEFEAQEGDLVFIPGGTAHYVWNTRKSVSLSMNYIDASNAAQAATSMENRALFDKVSGHLRSILALGTLSMSPNRVDVPWHQFVSDS